MVRGYYLFDCNIVNKSNQSVVAMSAYRSDERLYSLRDGETKSYKKHDVKPESFIMKPDNAPQWVMDRERLWNEVEEFEERDNAQLARNILLGLPNDFTEDQQSDITKEFVKENFVDEGMVADVSIHRDEENNPHAHILLTVRPFDEDGEWEKRKSKRVPVLDENGNQVYDEKGWRKTKSVKINNWDSKKTLMKWRRKWAEKLNEKSIEFGSNRVYSEKSYAEQGSIKKPTIRLTREEYYVEEKHKKKCEKKGIKYTPKTYYAKKNKEIKEYNKKYSNIIRLEDYKQEKKYKSYLDDVRKRHHFDKEKIKATSLLVDRVKGYVDYSVAKKLHNEFHDDRNKWKLKLERNKTSISVEKKLYSHLIKKYRTDKSYVEKYGYSKYGFKQEIKNDLLELKEREEKTNEEERKFEELKEATRLSLSHQEELTNIEFETVYDNADFDSFKIDEKYFAINLLKEHDILLPKEKIKNEYKKQSVENPNQYIPIWKQVKDTLTSIEIYDRSIERFNRINTDTISPEKYKNEVIKIGSIKELKRSYEDYIYEVDPLINDMIRNMPDGNKIVPENINAYVKVALLEEYSKMGQQEKENLNMKSLLNDLYNEYKEKSLVSEKMYEQKEENNEIYKDISSKTKEISDGILSLIEGMERPNDLNYKNRKRNKSKPKRMRGANGREI